MILIRINFKIKFSIIFFIQVKVIKVVSVHMLRINFEFFLVWNQICKKLFKINFEVEINSVTRN